LNKRALMLSVAAAALVSGGAFAQTTISTKQTSPYSTSSSGPITITSDGSIVVTTNPAVSPAVTINSGTASAPVFVTNQGTISYNGVGSSSSPVTGVELLGGSTGGLDNVGTINLTGAGTNKTGILVAPTGPFIGAINDTSSGTALNTETNLTVFDTTATTNPAAILLESGSTMKVQGDDSYGINIESGATLGCGNAMPSCSTAAKPSDIDIFGTLAMTPTSSSSSASTSTAVNVAGTMFGNINLVSGGSVTVEGNSTSTGITIVSGTTGTPGGVLNGNINVGGLLALTPISGTATTGGNIGIDMGGTMNGNIVIGNSGTVSATGAAAQGILVNGSFNGYIENEGVIETIGIASPSTTTTNPEAGPALGIGSNISGGIGNIAQVGSSVTTTISSIGGGTNYTIRIDPSLSNSATPGPITIGEFMGDADANGNHFAFFNSGTISGSAGDNFNTDETTFYITGGGTTTSVTTLDGGIYNSGTIESTARTNDKVTTGATATTLEFGSYSQLSNSAAEIENAAGGTISASVTGAEQGTATAIQIGQPGNATDADVPTIDNAGTISASVTTTSLAISNSGKSPPVFAAYGIYDNSGYLTTITNSGTISATATKLDDNSQITQAVNVAANNGSTNGMSGVNFYNTGTVTGDIVFGSGADTLDVGDVTDINPKTGMPFTTGATSSAPAVINGNINFGGTATYTSPSPGSMGTAGSTVTGCINAGTKGNDCLDVGAFGTVNSYIQETNGNLDIHVENGGTLNLLAPPVIGNTSIAPPVGTPLSAGTLTVDNGGTLGISVSQGYNILAYPNAQNLAIVDAATAAHLNGTVSVSFGGFVSTPGGKPAEFALIATPEGEFNTGAGDITPVNALGAISKSVQENMPYLFTGSLCTWNLSAGLGTCSGSNPVPGDSVLGLTVDPKTVGSDGCTTKLVIDNCNINHIPLTGNAAIIYPYANTALATDNALGTAMISAVKDSTTAELAYGSFVPDVTGATRAVAISLTDDASNVVAARQRELRQYADQDGDLTLWGQEFAQRLDQKTTSAGIPGYNDSGFGFALGADEGDPDAGRYGGAFEFFNGGEREAAPGSSKTTSEWYMLTGYTDWHGKGLFLDTQASVGYVNLKGNRYLNLLVPDTTTETNVPYGRDAFEQHPGEYLAGSAMTGATFNEDGTVLTPEVSLDGLAMREEPYTEGGGGPGYDLHVASSYAQSLRAFTGVDVRQDLNLTDFLLQPDLQAGYRYDFANGIQKLQANFVSVSPQSVFDVSGPRPDRGNIVAGGGLAVTTGAWSLGLNLDYLRAGSGSTGEEGTITLLARI
jgi:hypothetical protein